MIMSMCISRSGSVHAGLHVVEGLPGPVLLVQLAHHVLDRSVLHSSRACSPGCVSRLRWLTCSGSSRASCSVFSSPGACRGLASETAAFEKIMHTVPESRVVGELRETATLGKVMSTCVSRNRSPTLRKYRLHRVPVVRRAEPLVQVSSRRTRFWFGLARSLQKSPLFTQLLANSGALQKAGHRHGRWHLEAEGEWRCSSLRVRLIRDVTRAAAVMIPSYHSLHARFGMASATACWGVYGRMISERWW